jgi:uracil-DNA glycosylase family 4
MNGTIHHLLSEALLDPVKAEFADAAYPFMPLDSYGMPPAGPDFLAAAIAMGDDIDSSVVKRKKEPPTGENLKYLYRRALYDPTFSLRIAIKGGEAFVRFLPGHLWRPTGKRKHGPKKARVMIVGKIPGRDELADQRALSGRGVEPLHQALAELGVAEEEYSAWYVTFACKFGSPTPDNATIPAVWLKDCAPLLAQELRIVRPKYILCMGNEAAKAVLQTNGNVSGLAGRSLPITYQDEFGSKHEVKVMTCLNPAYVARKPEAYEDFKGQLSRFLDMTQNRTPQSEEVDHADIYTEETLTELVDAMLSDSTPGANIIAVDCEWHGDHPTEPGAYLRTVQISNQDRWARTIVLRYDGGAEAFRPSLDAARAQLRRLLKSTPDRHVRVGGHFFRADLPWLVDFGVDVRDEYAPAADPNDRTRGGWDTSLMYHAVCETAKFGLDDCVLRFTSAPPYWEELDKWKKRYRAKHKVKASELGGYGIIPGSVLHPYASYDVDVTRRIMLRFYGTDGTDGMLAHDQYGNDCWLPYWTAHQASLAFLEMEQTGLVIDRARSDEITTLFMNTQDRLLQEIREELNWPKFNPKSQPQLAVALFGLLFKDRYNTKIEVPEDVRPLDLVPIKTTGKRPTLWHELGFRGGNRDTATPSTDKESLGILGHRNTTAAKIRDYKFVAQVLQSVLRKPNVNEDGEFETDEEGHYEYDKGLIGAAHSDGKVRTHLFQTKETGRASSSRPPLQNLSSRREDDYKRILGDAHKHPVRSILRVPEGCVGIETDLTGAELAVLAWLSQDKNFIEHVRRNLLPEEHPDHYDIHSQQAVKAFCLRDVMPTKTGMKDAGKKGLRVAAKNVNFGIPYGRGAEAIARQCKEEGVEVSAEDCQKMIDAYFISYPKTYDFLAECRKRSQDPGWLVGPYGRYRRFLPANERSVIGEQERQAQNFPIQGGVADAVSIALNNFYRYRREHPEVKYDIALQIHDAIMLIVPVEHAERVYQEVVPKCMVEDVPFWPRYLDGTLIPAAEPYHFGADREVFVHWGEKLKPSQAKALGLNWLCSDA